MQSGVIMGRSMSTKLLRSTSNKRGSFTRGRFLTIHSKMEWHKRTIFENVRAMLLDAKINREFWLEAANTAVYLLNFFPKKNKKQSANEKFDEKKCD